MPSRIRKLVQIDVLHTGAVRERVLDFEGIRFEVTEHHIGWNLALARSLIERFDGYVDGIALHGIEKKGVAGPTQLLHPGYVDLMRAAVKTPVYLADDVREFFMAWTVRRLLQGHSQIFAGKKVLVHYGMLTPAIDQIALAGGQVQCADALLLGLPRLLRGQTALRAFLLSLKGVVRVGGLGPLDPRRSLASPRTRRALARWMKACDVFVTFGALLDSIADLSPLKGKVLLVDYLSTEARERVHLAGVSLAVECVPGKALPAGEANFALLAAVLDQVRLAEDSSASFEEYLQQWVKRAEADRAPVVGTERLPRRCAFVLHALSHDEFLRLRGQKLLARAPQPVRSLAGAVAARLPVVHLGALSGAVSRATGQEVVCDVFAHLAAPQEIGALGEERLYDRMVQAARLAKGRGASLLGLGDFIEGVGDGGVTIAQRSPIPVTLGSSYSASTRLWAARRMLERLALVQPSADGKRYLAKAMVIGATDSLGRVSSLMLALAAGELVLVAARPDKLVELQREIREVAPEVKVTVATQAGAELATTDLIVTAASPFSGAVLDLEQVKPGAVICDGAASIAPEDADERPDVMVVQSGDVLLPGKVHFEFDWGALTPSVAASMAETILLTMEGRFESFSLSRQLSLDKVKQIYQLGLKHGATLSQIRGPHGVISDEQVKSCRELALASLASR